MNGWAGGGAQYGSPITGPAITSSISATSRTVRAIGQFDESPCHASPCIGACVTRPRDGLRPTRPQHDAGIRIDPPPSVPAAIGAIPAATLTAAPPLDPPAV